MTQDRMELWSNDRLTEFAIKFNSVIVVKTSTNPDAMTKIDEGPYRSGYEFDWHYTLSQWVVYFLANKFTALLDSKTSLQKEFNIRDDEDKEVEVSLYPPRQWCHQDENQATSKTGSEMSFL